MQESDDSEDEEREEDEAVEEYDDNEDDEKEQSGKSTSYLVDLSPLSISESGPLLLRRLWFRCLLTLLWLCENERDVCLSLVVLLTLLCVDDAYIRFE